MEDHFADDALDTAVWLPYHLPHWSSRASSAATYQGDAVRPGSADVRGS